MIMSKWSGLGLGVLLATVAYLAPAMAQVPRSWVASNGNDANPCSRTLPCETLNRAHLVTQAGGEISIIDAAGVGAVTITKAITINGEGTLASILGSGGAGITVLAGNNDKVVIRNIQFNGSVAGGTAGVSVLSGHVTIDKCLIYGFTAGLLGGHGVLINTSGTSRVDIRDTDLSNNTNGVWAQTSGAGVAIVNLDNVRINGPTVGFGVITNNNNVFVSINRSHIATGSGTALHTNAGNGVINLSNSHLTNNNVAVNAANAGSVIRINGNAIFNNATGFMIAAGATIATGNNNKTAANGGVTGPNASIGTQ